MAFSLKKYRLKFLDLYWNFQQKKGGVLKEERLEMEGHLKRFQSHILEKNLDSCKDTYDALKKIEEKLFPRARYYRWCKAFFFNALFIGIIIVLRQSWFENYQIPTGSMRPTLKELDRLIVSKHQFGINVPLTPDHFLFEPDEVKRGGIITFTGENMDIYGVKTKHFYLFDGYKQYVKRLIGKPGDTLYFYGGNLYGLDKNGEDITPEFRTTTFENLEHIPFMRLDGKLRLLKNTLYVYQYNIPVARVDRTSWGSFLGRVIYNNDPSQKPIENYSDLFGMHNFGMCRIEKEGDKHLLKIFHHPSLSLDKQLFQKQKIGHLEHQTSSIVLDESLLRTLFSSLQTSRFVVKNSLAFPWDNEGDTYSETSYRPILKGVPDGTYEFFDGKGYQVYTQGFTRELSNDHPLMQFDIERAITLFNFGTEFDVRYGADSGIAGLLPSRYIYFRDLDL
ncbi:MAG: signal peptidase I, partial [Chlamydiia bacterium]